MLNMLRMDLYRLRKSKVVYVCFAIILAIQVLCYVMVYLVGTEEGRQLAEKIGMSVLTESSVDEAMEGMNSLLMFRDGCMDGGVYGTIFGIVIALFLCVDFQGGFVKNIITHHGVRRKYVGSKLMTAGILNFLYLMLSYGFNTLLNLLFGNMVPYASLADSAFYLGWMWLLSTAFGALVIMLCVWTRSAVIGVLAAVFFGNGIIVTPLASIMNLFQLGGWIRYTLYFNMSYGPSSYAALGDLKIFAIGIVFLALYSVVASVSLMRRDI